MKFMNQKKKKKAYLEIFFKKKMKNKTLTRYFQKLIVALYLILVKEDYLEIIIKGVSSEIWVGDYLKIQNKGDYSLILMGSYFQVPVTLCFLEIKKKKKIIKLM